MTPSWLIPWSFSFLLFTDISYAQFGRWGVWDPPHHTSTWDGDWPGPVWSRFTFPSDARAPVPAQGSLNPPIPSSEPGSALYYHLTQHDGPGRNVCQQRPTCGEYHRAYLPRVNQSPLVFCDASNMVLPHSHMSTQNPAVGLIDLCSCSSTCDLQWIWCILK